MCTLIKLIKGGTIIITQIYKFLCRNNTRTRFVPSVASQKMIIGNDIGRDAILGLKSKSLSLDSYLHHLLMNHGYT